MPLDRFDCNRFPPSPPSHPFASYKRIERSKYMNHTRKKTLWSCPCPLSMGKLLENSARSSSFGLARVQLQSRRTKTTNSVAVGMSTSTIMVLYREKNDETFAGEILFDPTNVLRRTISVVTRLNKNIA